MSAPHPLNQAVIAQALYDLRNGQLRRCKAMGFSEAELDALKHPAMVSVLANANVSWCSVSVNREVLRRLLSQAQDVEKEIATVDRMLRLGASTEMVSRFYGLTHQEVALRREVLGLPKRKGRHPVLDEKQDVDPFLSCCVAALAGPVGEPEYRYFDTIVATPEAEHLVRRCVQAIEGDRKVLIAFRLNDMKIDPYIRTKGERAGEPGASLESTLVHIGLIKIDGTQVYPTSQAQAEAPQAEDTPAPEAEVAADTAADQPVEPAEREPAGEVEEEPALAASF